MQELGSHVPITNRKKPPAGFSSIQSKNVTSPSRMYLLVTLSIIMYTINPNNNKPTYNFIEQYHFVIFSVSLLLLASDDVPVLLLSSLFGTLSTTGSVASGAAVSRPFGTKSIETSVSKVMIKKLCCD